MHTAKVSPYVSGSHLSRSYTHGSLIICCICLRAPLLLSPFPVLHWHNTGRKHARARAAGQDSSSPPTGFSRLCVQTTADKPSLGVELCCSSSAAEGPAWNSAGALCRELKRKERERIRRFERRQTSSHSGVSRQHGWEFSETNRNALTPKTGGEYSNNRICLNGMFRLAAFNGATHVLQSRRLNGSGVRRLTGRRRDVQASKYVRKKKNSPFKQFFILFF